MNMSVQELKPSYITSVYTRYCQLVLFNVITITFVIFIGKACGCCHALYGSRVYITVLRLQWLYARMLTSTYPANALVHDGFEVHRV